MKKIIPAFILSVLPLSVFACGSLPDWAISFNEIPLVKYLLQFKGILPIAFILMIVWLLVNIFLFFFTKIEVNKAKLKNRIIWLSVWVLIIFSIWAFIGITTPTFCADSVGVNIGNQAFYIIP